KQVAGSLKLELAQYREMAAFAQFGSDLDAVTQALLAKGVRMTEMLKQGQYDPLSVEKQIVVIYAATRGWVKSQPVTKLVAYERELLKYMEAKHQAILDTLAKQKKLTKESEADLDKALEAFNTQFNA
ncbi:MAG: F0F1 ATP synthase subunit alpha, partial [Deltaproteobacteria bacterium CG17_big_fil_post_rev_8_21_14_2_50_63_7]